MYLVPSDPAADIAVLRLDAQLVPNIEAYKFVDTPSRLLPTDSELSDIASRKRDYARNLPGQTVTTAGLRAQIPADPGAFLVPQSGVLFSTADQPINIQCGDRNAFRPLRVWFIDGAIGQGISGAPIYTTLARNGERSPSTVLLGVQAIAWPDRGVAGITPASALAQLIETAITTQHRRNNQGSDKGREERPGQQPGISNEATPEPSKSSISHSSREAKAR